MNITQSTENYWAQVRQLEQTLPKEVTIISVPAPFDPSHKAGVICDQARFYAAQRIVEGSHRLANAEEIAGFLAATVEAQKKAKEAEIEAKGIHIHPTVVQPVVTPPKGK